MRLINKIINLMRNVVGIEIEIFNLYLGLSHIKIIIRFFSNEILLGFHSITKIISEKKKKNDFFDLVIIILSFKLQDRIRYILNNNYYYILVNRKSNIHFYHC